jgi:glycine C-acetyltransferase
MVDECHAAGFIGATGKNTKAKGVMGVDIITGTLGRSSWRHGWLYYCKKRNYRNVASKSRPYLFSNSLAQQLSVHLLKFLNF